MTNSVHLQFTIRKSRSTVLKASSSNDCLLIFSNIGT